MWLAQYVRHVKGRKLIQNTYCNKLHAQMAHNKDDLKWQQKKRKKRKKKARATLASLSSGAVLGAKECSFPSAEWRKRKK